MKLSELKREAKHCIEIYCDYVLTNTEEPITKEVHKFSKEINKELSQCKSRKQIFIIIERELPDFIYNSLLLRYKKDEYKQIAWEYIIDKAHVEGKYDDRLIDFYKQIDHSESKYFDKLKSIIDISPNYISERRYNDKHGIRARDNLYEIIAGNI